MASDFAPKTTWMLVKMIVACISVACYANAAPQELGINRDSHRHHQVVVELDNNNITDAYVVSTDNRRQPHEHITAIALGADSYNLSSTNNDSADLGAMRQSRPPLECYRCLPNSDNDYCSDRHVGEKVDCLTGRCLIFGARIKANNRISRLYLCDTHNIADFAFQVLRSARDLQPNTCDELNYDIENTLKIFRNYGMGPSIADLAQIQREDIERRPGALRDSVEKLEMCSCTETLCNSPEAHRRMTLLKPGRSAANAVGLIALPTLVLSVLISLKNRLIMA